MKLLNSAIAGLLLMQSTAQAVIVCGLTDSIDLSGSKPLPFGGETIGIGPEGGRIVNATLDVTFTATGQFDAADIGVWLYVSLQSGFAGFGFHGQDLGWSGQGTFTAHLQTNVLNDYLNSFGNPWSTWFIDTVNFNFENGPITGTFEELIFRLTYAPCPVGDVNHDASVGVPDLLAVLGAWGACEPPPASCPADVNHDGVVGVPDLLAVIGHWQSFCPNCK